MRLRILRADQYEYADTSRRQVSACARSMQVPPDTTSLAPRRAANRMLDFVLTILVDNFFIVLA